MPLIVSLEVHCSPSQQEVMVDLMNDYWGACLVRKPDDFSDATPLPSLEDLKKKILVKVKYSPPEKARKAEATVTSQKADDTSSDDEDTEAVAKGKIIEKLSNMSVPRLLRPSTTLLTASIGVSSPEPSTSTTLSNRKPLSQPTFSP
jgi:hypothetical protein